MMASKTLAQSREKIVDTYNDDYNITFIHGRIVEMLEREHLTRIPRINEEISKLEKVIRLPQTQIQRNMTRKEIESLQAMKQEILSGNRVQIYQRESQPMIKKYKSFKSTCSRVKFGLSETKAISDDICWEKIAVIEEYFLLAKNYIEIDIYRVTSRQPGCISCNFPITEDILTNFDKTVCRRCGAEQGDLIYSRSSKDNTKSASTNDKKDETIKNFLKAFEKYQGLENVKLPSDLEEKLDEYFTSKGILPGSSIRQLPLNSRGRRGDTTPQMLWAALPQIGYNDLYKHTNKIGSEYWGWVLPNVQHLKEIITDDYHKTQAVFHNIPPEERIRDSSLGTEYRLYRHLQMRGHECYMDDFKIANDPNSLCIHNDNWRRMVEGVGEPGFFYFDDRE